MLSSTSSGLNLRKMMDQIIYKCAELITHNTEEYFLFGFLMDLPFNVLYDIYQKKWSMFLKYKEMLKCGYEFLGSDFILYFQKALKKMNKDIVLTQLVKMYGCMFAESGFDVVLGDKSNELYTLFQMCIEKSKTKKDTALNYFLNEQRK